MRSAAAAVLAPLALAAVWVGMPWFALAVAAVLVLAGGEWRRLCGLEARGVGTVLLTLPAFLALVVGLAGPGSGLILLLLALASAAFAFGSPAGERAWAGAGVLVLGLATVAAIVLRVRTEAGPALVVFLFAVVWLADIGGYAFGRALGGPKLAPRISPAKTWAGAAGAVALPVAGAALAALFVPFDAGVAVALAVVLSLVAQLGDLAESWAERRHGAKDSGALIPGHGGVLDRIDGLLFAAPVLAVIDRLSGAGQYLWP